MTMTLPEIHQKAHEAVSYLIDRYVADGDQYALARLKSVLVSNAVWALEAHAAGGSEPVEPPRAPAYDTSSVFADEEDDEEATRPGNRED